MRMLTVERPQGFTPERAGANPLDLDVEPFQTGADVETLSRVMEGDVASDLAGSETTVAELSDAEVDEEFAELTENLEETAELEPIENNRKWESKKDWAGPRGAKK